MVFTSAPITFFEPKQMKIATAFMLAHPYGFPRVMSSYVWNRYCSIASFLLRCSSCFNNWSTLYSKEPNTTKMYSHTSKHLYLLVFTISCLNRIAQNMGII